MKCELCGGNTLKVIYFGLPGRLCENEDCHNLSGLAAFAPVVSTETWDGPQFAFMVYDGSYWAALAFWLFGNQNEET